MRGTIVIAAFLWVAIAGQQARCGFIALASGPGPATIGADGSLSLTTAGVLIIPGATPLNPTSIFSPADASVSITLGPPFSGSPAAGYSFGAGGSFVATGRLASQGPEVVLASATLGVGQLLRIDLGSQGVEYELFLGADQDFTIDAGLAAYYGVRATGSGALMASFMEGPSGLIGVGSQAKITTTADSSVPEPAGLAMVGVGLACSGASRLRLAGRRGASPAGTAWGR